MIKKKILVSGHFGKFGGTRTYLTNLLELLFKNNYDVVIAILNEDSLLIELVKKMKFEYLIIPHESNFISIQRRIPIVRFVINLLSNTIEYFRFKKIIMKYDLDLGIFSGWEPTGRFGSFILLPFSKICVVHSYPVGAIRKSLRNILTKKIGKNSLLLTVSEYSKKTIIKYWLNEETSENCHVIYNGVKDNNSVCVDKNKKKIVLTFGHTVWYKNPLLWIDIAKKTISKFGNDINFIWVGDGELFSRCKEEVSRDWEKNIKFMGFSSEIDKFYAEATIYFQPSQLESHGISVIDAMKHGIPCIVSDQGGLKESVMNMKEGFVISLNNTEKIVDKIGLLLGDVSLRNKMGENARRRYESKFTHKLWEYHTLEIIYKLGK